VLCLMIGANGDPLIDALLSKRVKSSACAVA
jgi:hypothetical protein